MCIVFSSVNETYKGMLSERARAIFTSPSSAGLEPLDLIEMHVQRRGHAVAIVRQYLHTEDMTKGWRCKLASLLKDSARSFPIAPYIRMKISSRTSSGSFLIGAANEDRASMCRCMIACRSSIWERTAFSCSLSLRSWRFISSSSAMEPRPRSLPEMSFSLSSCWKEGGKGPEVNERSQLGHREIVKGSL